MQISESMTPSILSQVRADAYAKGFRQGTMAGFDEAYENGRADALREAGLDKCDIRLEDSNGLPCPVTKVTLSSRG